MTKPAFPQDKILSKIEEEFKRHTHVLREDFEKQVRTVAEQYGSIVQKLNEHDQRLIRIEGGLQQHDLEFVKVYARFDSMENRFDHLENRFDHLENRFDKLDKQIGTVLTDHEHRLKGIEQKS